MPSFTYCYCGVRQQRVAFPVICRHEECNHFEEYEDLSCKCIYPAKVKKVKKDVVHNKNAV